MELRSTPHCISDLAAASIADVGSLAGKINDCYKYCTIVVTPVLFSECPEFKSQHGDRIALILNVCVSVTLFLIS
jgi:hypothetical protein